MFLQTNPPKPGRASACQGAFKVTSLWYRGGMTKTKASTVRWDPAVARRLKVFADSRRQSVNAAANYLVERGLEAEQAAAQK